MAEDFWKFETSNIKLKLEVKKSYAGRFSNAVTIVDKRCLNLGTRPFGEVNRTGILET